MSTPPTDPEQPEEDVAALRDRIRELERGGAKPPRTGWWRSVVVVVLLVLGAVTAPLTVVAVWANDQVGDTDRYVETVTPLASDPAVQAAISDRVADEIVKHIRAEEITAEALSAIAGQSFVPPRAAALLPSLAVPLSNAIEEFIRNRVDDLVKSDAFQNAWVEANRQAHAQMVEVLTGKSDGSVSVTDGDVSINIAVLVQTVKQRLIEDGFQWAERIPDVTATFTIFHAENIGTARKVFSWLDTGARVLPILGILLIGTAVLVARDRRKALLGAGLAVAISMVLLGLMLNLVRPAYLDAVPSDVLPTDAAAVIYDQIVRFIRTSLRAVGIVGLAIALAALFFAPTGAGAALRRGAGGAVGRVRRGTGVDTGPVGRFLGTYRAFSRWLVVGLGALVYLSLDHPTGLNATVIIAVVVVVLIVVEFLAAPADEVAATESTSTS